MIHPHVYIDGRKPKRGTRIWIIWALATMFVAFRISAASALQTELVLQSAHHYYINAIALSPNNRQLISGGADTTALLWEMESGRTIRAFPHGKRIDSAAFSRDGQKILTAGEGLVVWDVATGAEIRRFTTYGSFQHAEFSLDGKMVITSDAESVKLWSVSSGALVRRFGAPQDELSSVALSKNGERLIVGGADGHARLWDLMADREIRVFDGVAERYLDFSFSPNGHLAIAGTESGSVILFDVDTGKEVRRFEGTKLAVYSVGFSPDGSKAIAGSADGKVVVWATDTGKFLWGIEGYQHTAIRVVFDSTGSRVAVASLTRIELWDCNTGKNMRNFESRTTDVTSVAYRPLAPQLAVATRDNTVSLWDLSSGLVIRRFAGHVDGVAARGVTSIAFSSNGAQILSGGEDTTARLWDVNTGKELFKLVGHQDAVTAVAFSPDNSLLLTGSDDRTARLWQSNNGTAVHQFQGSAGLITAVAFSHDGNQIYTGSSNATVWLWDVATGSRVREFVGLSQAQPVTFEERIDVAHGKSRIYERRQGEVISMALSPDGLRLVAGGRDGFALLWDATTGRLLHPFACKAAVTAVAFSSDGRLLITGSEDNIGRIWDVLSGKELRQFVGHSDFISSVANSIDGRFILTGSRDGTAAVWSMRDGKRLATLTSLANEGWVIIARNGRFDTSELDGNAPMSWIVSDQRLRPLPPEIFMRDYYEPKLLPKLLEPGDGAIRQIGDISNLNRIQPKVAIAVPVRGSTRSEALVDVAVFGRTDPSQKNGKTTTGAYDLRLFRNGQLVGEYPEPEGGSAGPQDIAAWRKASVLKPTVDGRSATTHTFHVRLSSADHGKPVVFTAYAFNEDRVKSETARNDAFKVPENIARRAARAYVLTVGINDYHTPMHDLEFAAKDAQMMAVALGKIKGHEVVTITLVTNKAHDGVGAVSQATKANIRAVFEVLAGKGDAAQERERLRAAGIDTKVIAKLDKVTPDDAVIITYSGHGYTELSGAFYLLPAGSWAGEKITKDSLAEFISSDELSEWLRDVDAGEIALVIDACHSAASVDIPGFRPGPMGDRGLGQLAYDKGIRILAASQSDDVAVEIRDLQEGLLTYALVEDGLTRDSSGKLPAAPDGKGEVSLSAWLEYGEQRTPGLYIDALQHKVKFKPRDSTIDAAFLPAFIAAQQKHAQTPALFDFHKLTESVELGY